MRKYSINIEMPKGEVKRILEELEAAQEKIYECYSKLRDLGVITIKEETTSGN